eukprot:scaffold10456_cov45-Cyclotella_meneghiniana.AAC.4
MKSYRRSGRTICLRRNYEILRDPPSALVPWIGPVPGRLCKLIARGFVYSGGGLGISPPSNSQKHRCLELEYEKPSRLLVFCRHHTLQSSALEPTLLAWAEL